MLTNAEAAASLEGTSIQSFVSSLVVNLVTSAIFLILFVILRTQLHRIYEPRAYLDNLQDEKRMAKLPRKPWGWIGPLLKIYFDKRLIIEKSGMDAYFFIRFLRMILIIFIPALVVIWPILLPINYIHGVGSTNLARNQTSVTGLDRFAFGNVNRAHTSKYWAHLVLAYLLVFWICLVSFYELQNFVKTRQEWLVSQKHREKASATTILVTAIPQAFLNENKIRELYSCLPGGVKRVWLNRHLAQLLVDVNNRDSIARQLEAAELILIQRLHHRFRSASSSATVDELDNDEKVRLLVTDRSLRPNHRLPLFPWLFSFPNWTFLGLKVDTIDWCKAELSRMNPEIEEKQKNPDDHYQPMNSAFVQFHKQIAAHMAVQSVAHHTVNAMTPRYLEVSPHEVLWNNMQLKWWERYLWTALVLAVILAFTIFFAIPTAFIGTLSHITALVELLPWLSFLNTDTSGAKFWSGLVTGVLPSVLLGLLLLLVPILMKLAVRLQGHPTRTEVSLHVQNMYFIFLFVQLFLVITISSGITTLISSALKNPAEIPQLLATNLPKAANFFFSYLLLQGLSQSSGDLLQWWWILVHYVATALTSTPRSQWKRWNNLRTNTWGTTYPVFTNLAAIGIIYSIIAPLIMIFVIIAFVLFGVAEIHNFSFVFDLVIDTGGLSFPKAIQQIFCGVYFLELSLTGLFFLVRNADDSGVPCKVQGILMVVLIVLTILFQALLYHEFHPLIRHLPLESFKENEADDRVPLLTTQTNMSASFTQIDDNSGLEREKAADDASDLENPRSDMLTQDHISHNHREALLLEAYKHEALRRRRPIIWIPQDSLGIAASEIANMPQYVEASFEGARLNDKGTAEFFGNPPDYVRSDDILL